MEEQNKVGMPPKRKLRNAALIFLILAGVFTFVMPFFSLDQRHTQVMSNNEHRITALEERVKKLEAQIGVVSTPTPSPTTETGQNH